jgi:hypothetical protein
MYYLIQLVLLYSNTKDPSPTIQKSIQQAAETSPESVVQTKTRKQLLEEALANYKDSQEFEDDDHDLGLLSDFFKPKEANKKARGRPAAKGKKSGSKA